MEGIKNIIFDLGGVLTELNGNRCIDAFRQIGAHDVVKYVEEHRTEDLFLDVELGRITTGEFCDEVRRICSCRASDCDIVWAWNSLLTPIPAEKLLKLLSLRSRYRVFLLSNTNDMHWNKCSTDFFRYNNYTAEDFFERIFLSFEMHLAKPSADIFYRVMETAGLIPAETLFIDDSAENCESARRLGIWSMQNTTSDYWMNKI